MNEPTNFCGCGASSNQPNVALLLGGVIVGAAAGLLFLPVLALFAALMIIVAGGRKLWRSVTRADARSATIENASIAREFSTASKK